MVKAPANNIEVAERRRASSKRLRLAAERAAVMALTSPT
jgi:hypothetical protein